MVTKINGASASGEALTGNLDFWTIQTTVDITPTGVVASASDANPSGVWPATIKGVTYATENDYNAAKATQASFDAIVRGVSMRAQPIIIGDVSETEEAAPVFGLPVTNSEISGTPVTVYTVKFAIEHHGAWDDTDESLLDTMNGIDDFVYATPTTNNNIYAVKNELL